MLNYEKSPCCSTSDNKGGVFLGIPLMGRDVPKIRMHPWQWSQVTQVLIKCRFSHCVYQYSRPFWWCFIIPCKFMQTIRGIPANNTPLAKNTPVKCPKSVLRGGVFLALKSGRRPDFAKGGPFTAFLVLRTPPLKCPKSVLTGGVLSWNTPDQFRSRISHSGGRKLLCCEKHSLPFFGASSPPSKNSPELVRSPIAF